MVLSPAWHADPTPCILSPTLLWPSLTRPPWTACPQNKCWDLTRTFISSMPVTQLHLMLPCVLLPALQAMLPIRLSATPSQQPGTCC